MDLTHHLIIKFNRFEYTIVNGQHTMEKINGQITYPIKDLDLSRYISSPLIEQTIYDLYAINCHVGCLNTGHYYAICYNESMNAWVRYNDDQINIFNESADLVSNDAYILFYRKRI